MTRDDLIAWEERAAIMEYLGGLSRAEAEYWARSIVVAQHAASLSPTQQDLPNMTYRTRNMRGEMP